MGTAPALPTTRQLPFVCAPSQKTSKPKVVVNADSESQVSVVRYLQGLVQQWDR